MSYTPNIDVDDVFMFNLKLHQGITNKETVSCIYKSYHTSHISSSIESIQYHHAGGRSSTYSISEYQVLVHYVLTIAATDWNCNENYNCKQVI